MLATLRQHHKVLLYVIAALIIPTFVMWGGYSKSFKKKPGEGEVVKVNGIPITEEALRKRIAQTRARFRDWDPAMFEATGMTKVALNDLINSALLMHEAERVGIRVSREAAEGQLRRWPIFMKDGSFDAARYNRFLANDDVSWDDLYEELKRQVQINRLVADLEDTVKVTEKELTEFYRMMNQEVKVKYLALGPRDFEDDVDVTEEMLNDHYEKNRGNYMEPEKRKARYVAARVAPSDADREAVREKARDTLAKAKQGEDFADLAKRYSEAPRAEETKGDLGWREERSFAEPLASAVAALAEGELSDVVESEHAVYLFKCDGRKEEDAKKQVKLYQIMFRFTASAETREEIASQIDALLEQTREDTSLDVAAENAGLEVKETGFFSRRDRFIPDIGMDSARFVQVAFALDLGEVSSAIITDTRYYVVQPVEEREPRIPELSEIEDQVRREVADWEALRMAHEKVSEIASRITSLDDLEKVDETFASKVKTSKPFTRFGFGADVVGDREFHAAAFRAEPGRLSSPILGSKGAYLLEVVEKLPLDEEEYQKDKEQLKEQLLAQKKRMLYRDWQQWLRAKADVRYNEKLLAEILER